MLRTSRKNTKVHKGEITIGKISLGAGFTVIIPDANPNKKYTLVGNNTLLEDIIFVGVSGRLLQTGFYFKMDEEI